jgi:hypothetical protein
LKSTTNTLLVVLVGVIFVGSQVARIIFNPGTLLFFHIYKIRASTIASTHGCIAGTSLVTKALEFTRTKG